MRIHQDQGSGLDLRDKRREQRRISLRDSRRREIRHVGLDLGPVREANVVMSSFPKKTYEDVPN